MLSKWVGRFGRRSGAREKSRIGCAAGIRPDEANPELEISCQEPLKTSGAQPRPDPNEKLVKVFDSEQESEALIVKGLLDSAGIDNDLTSASLVQDAFPGLGGTLILVRQDDAAAAQKLIAEYRQPAFDDDETAEIEIIEDPPEKP